MDITTILNLQRELDKATREKFAPQDAKLTRQKKLIALLVEVGEFANEHGGFKYWKPQHKIDKAKMYEEYADVVHFLCSFAIEFDFPTQINSRLITKEINEQLLEVFASCAKLKSELTLANVARAMELFFGVGVLIGMNDEMILSEYERKNTINFLRMKNGY